MSEEPPRKDELLIPLRGPARPMKYGAQFHPEEIKAIAARVFGGKAVVWSDLTRRIRLAEWDEQQRRERPGAKAEGQG